MPCWYYWCQQSDSLDLDHGSAELIHHPAYFTSHHQIAKAVDVVAIEIASEVAPRFAHSQYDMPHKFQSMIGATLA